MIVGLGLSALWVLRGWRNPAQVVRRLPPSARPGVERVTGRIERVLTNGERAVVLADGTRIEADAMILALGATNGPTALPGLAEALGFPAAGKFYTVAGAAEFTRRSDGSRPARSSSSLRPCPTGAQPRPTRRRS